MAAVACVFIGACHGPSHPSPPTPAAPTIACGGPIVVEGIASTTATVTYAAPSATNGSPPVSVSCAPASDSQFPIGDTTVTCTATDALARQASCSFTVTVHHRPFTFTKYLAFGDSITEGENGRPIRGRPFIDTVNAYPTLLRQMFAELVPDQSVTVENAGVGGERVADSGIRLRERIAATHPEVLLLLEGINDLNEGAGATTVMLALRDRIRDARDRRVQYVFVSTLLPVAPENCGQPPPNCRGLSTNNDAIAATNQAIRGMVPSNGGYLVDPYDQFFANRSTYIDIDGLHLRPEGNRALATAFWNRMLESIPATLLLGSPPQ